MDPVIKKRQLKTANPTGRSDEDAIRTGLVALDGVERVEVRPPDRINVVYDMMQVNLKKIDRTLSRLGHPLDGGLLRRIRRGWIGYTEQNMRDHLRTPPQPCCANPQLVADDDRCKVCGNPTPRHRPR